MLQDFRCDCLFIFVFDILGDKWMLVIVKQMLVEGKEIFKDFMESDEAIVINIFFIKFKLLEEVGIIIKIKWLGNKKINYYFLMDMGFVLMFIFVELAIWSDSYFRGLNLFIVDGEVMELMCRDKVVFVSVLEQNYWVKLVVMVYE